jgi:hypothetical protein
MQASSGIGGSVADTMHSLARGPVGDADFGIGESCILVQMQVSNLISCSAAPNADFGLDQSHTVSSATIRITGRRLSLATVDTCLAKHRFWHHPITAWALNLIICISQPTFCPSPSLLPSLFSNIFPSKPPTLNHQYI